MGKKYTIEDVRQIFASEGCVLISTEFYKVNKKLQYICKCGNKYETRLANFLYGNRCYDCGRKTQIENQKQKTINQLKDICKSNNCEFIKLENNIINFICSCGKSGSKTYKKFKYYPNCRDCALESLKKHNSRPDQEQYLKERKIYKYSIGTINMFMKTKTTGGKKINEFGYGPKELQNHIYNHPDYEKVKNNFSIDHIFPLTAFFKNGIYNLNIINHLTNIRPYDQNKNKTKNCSYNKDDFKNWLKEIGYNTEQKEII